MQHNLDNIIEMKGGDRVETLTAICRGMWDTCAHQSRQIQELQLRILGLELKVKELEEK
jgi:hypothetical protein